MNEKVQIHLCGPSTDMCKCKCPDGPCEHQWDGPVVTSENGNSASVTCSKCGMLAMEHDTWVLP